jgi:branched-chain amino acid transport system substrate-binding protein
MHVIHIRQPPLGAVSDFSPGHDSEEAFEKSFTAAGGEVAGKLRMPLVNPDYGELGLAKAGIALITSSDIATDEELTDAAVGVVSSFHYTATGNRPANKAFATAYKKEYGEQQNPEFVAVAAWDTMDAIYYPIREQKGRLNPDRTMELIKSYRNTDSPRGPISIDPATRDVVHNEYLREIRKVGNRVVNVELETIGVAVKDPGPQLGKAR